jgi:hypothetical protein
MIKSLREAVFGLGGTTVKALQTAHESIETQKAFLKVNIDKASAARQAAISAIVQELAEIAEVAQKYA